MDLMKAKKAAGIRGVKIAEALNVSQGTVSRWLHREVAVPTKYIRELAGLLKIKPEQVLPPDPVRESKTESIHQE